MKKIILLLILIIFVIVLGLSAESELRSFMKNEDVRFSFRMSDAGRETGFIIHVQSIEIHGEKVK